MALDATFQQLCAQLLALHDVFAGLRTTVREDKPLQDDVVLVDLFGDAADDVLGLIEEALAAARDAQQAALSPATLSQASHGLTICHDRHNQVSHRCSADLLCYERIRELRRFGRRRGGEWRAWSRSVKAALDSCRQPLFEVDDAILRSWHELVERAGLPSVSVQSTTIGQHLTLRPSVT